MLRLRQPEELLAVRTIAKGGGGDGGNVVTSEIAAGLPISPPEEEIDESQRQVSRDLLASPGHLNLSSYFFQVLHTILQRQSLASSTQVARLAAVRKQRALLTTSTSELQCFPSAPQVVPLNSAPVMLTASAPVTTGKRKLLQNGCIMWVHLQASICTEWEQNSMVLNPGSQVGASVTTTATAAAVTPTSVGPKTTKSVVAAPVTSPNQGISSILQVRRGINEIKEDLLLNRPLYAFQALNGTNRSASHSVPSVNGGGGSGNKKPKTIHRCILQRVNRTKGSSSSLRCHVCDAPYESYRTYLGHLLDSTCAKRKEEKEATAASNGAPVIVAEVINKRGRGASGGPARPPLKKSRSAAPPPAPTSAPASSGEPGVFRLLTCDSDEIIVEHETRTANGDTSRVYKRNLSEPLIIRTMPQQYQQAKQRSSRVGQMPSALDAQRQPIKASANPGAASPGSPPPKQLSPTGEAVAEDAPLNLTVSKTPPAATPAPEMPALMPIGGKRKEPPPASPAEAEAARKRLRTMSLCPHKAAVSLTPLSLVEHAADQARLVNLKVQLTNLMVSLMGGETWLTERGYPEKDILALLRSVLEAARSKVEMRAECDVECTTDSQAVGQVRNKK